MYNLSMNKLVAGSKGFLVSSEHLMEALHAKVPLRILDTTLFRPLVDKDNNAVYLKERIPGASFLDIDTVADHSIEGITHQTPLEKEWVQFMQTYDVSASDDIVLYDDLACAGASKFWWSFAQYGKKCYLLDGGFNAWKKAGGPVETGEPTYKHRKLPAEAYHFKLDAQNMLNYDDVNACSYAIRNEKIDYELVDARAGPRFRGEVEEPRPGMRVGHIPGSKNVFFKDLLTEDGTFKSETEIRAEFEKAGVDLNKNIVMTCGSSVTASVLNFALLQIGHKGKRHIFGPSWSLYGKHPEPTDA